MHVSNIFRYKTSRLAKRFGGQKGSFFPVIAGRDQYLFVSQRWSDMDWSTQRQVALEKPRKTGQCGNFGQKLVGDPEKMDKDS